MKRKKINKAIEVLRDLCETQPDDCSGCPFRDTLGCRLETIPCCWKTLKKEKKNNEDH